VKASDVTLDVDRCNIEALTAKVQADNFKLLPGGAVCALAYSYVYIEVLR